MEVACWGLLRVPNAMCGVGMATPLANNIQCEKKKGETFIECIMHALVFQLMSSIILTTYMLVAPTASRGLLSSRVEECRASSSSVCSGRHVLQKAEGSWKYLPSNTFPHLSLECTHTS